MQLCCRYPWQMHERGLAEEFGVFCCLAYSVRIWGANGRRFCAIACHGVGAYQGQLDHNDAHVVPFARTLGRWPWPFGRLAASRAILGGLGRFLQAAWGTKGDSWWLRRRLGIIMWNSNSSAGSSAVPAGCLAGASAAGACFRSGRPWGACHSAAPRIFIRQRRPAEPRPFST